MVVKVKGAKKKLKIAIAGKYQTVGDYVLPDAYACVLESLRHAGCQFGYSPEIIWIDTEKLEKDKTLINKLNEVNGIIIPQGWGFRGVEGKIKVAQYARERKIPYLGLCFGMQIAVIEFARNVLGLREANSQEIDSKTTYPVIHIMPKQKEYLAKKQYGGTIRLGAWPCEINPKSKLYQIYSKKRILERHRHRYEFNLKYKNMFEKEGMIISGISPDKKLVEAIELSQNLHPFFIGVQFHPEYKSRFLKPHPIFLEFIKTCISC